MHGVRQAELLERGCDRLRRLGLETEARLCVGEPVKAIAAYARDKKVDLVVVGHRRRSMLERWWSGSSGAYLSDHVGCTLLIEIDDPEERAHKLRAWLALPRHLYVRLADGSKVHARFDARQVGEDRLSSVQYLKFPTGGRVPMALGADHPELQGEAPLSAEQQAALAEDLRD